jgi:hypothetical protein
MADATIADKGVCNTPLRVSEKYVLPREYMVRIFRKGTKCFSINQIFATVVQDGCWWGV